jgi:hypothetical protein
MDAILSQRKGHPWKINIKCHGDTTDGGVFAYGVPVWREPQLQREPYGEPFRSCSYCGSVHPEDLLAFLTAGATLHGADWKYGWPHKFYVEGIPNPHAGKLVEIGGKMGPDVIEKTPGAVWKNTCGHADCQKRTRDHGYWFLPMIASAPKTTQAKFYNTHLNDCSDELFAKLVPVLKQQTGIEWERDEGVIKYQAPRYGHQA